MSADPGPAFRPGESVAAYRIERLLGSGGMGAVVHAYDTTLHRPVALKVLTGATTGDTARAQLLREARSAAALSHPNICTIYEVGEVESCAFIAMEYVDGRSIRSRLGAGALPHDEVVRYGVQAADALAWAHEHGVVHRDFKAANVIVTGDGRLKVVDFGLARRSDPLILDATTMMSIAAPGTVLGTPYAMAPEQVRGEATDPRTDIWALGVLLYEMTTGAQPFSGTSVPEIFSAVLRDPPAPHRALSPGMQRIVDRCLEKEPSARYQQAQEVRAALETLQSAGLPAPASAGQRRRVSPVVAVSAALAGILAIVLGFNAGTIRDRLAGGSARGPTTLAVLPLVNGTSDPDQQPFIDGLTEQLLTRLSSSDATALRVVASALSTRHARSDRPVAEIARDLEADHVLRGSVTRTGDRVGVTVELIHASDNRQVWQETYDRRVSDLVTLDSDISAAVSRALDVVPAVNNPAPAAKARAVDPAAFDLYLRGVSHTLRTNEPDLDQAIALLEQSAAIDPAFQSTQAYLALAYGNKSATYRPNEPIWEEKGFAAAQKALLLDPDSPEAHYAQAIMLWRPSHAFPSKEALAELRKALAVRQNFDEAWHQYGLILMHVGHLDDGVRAVERAVQINPRNTLARFRFGPIRVYQLQFEEAIAALNRVPPDTFPAQWTYQRAWALLSLGRVDEARTVIDRALVENPVDQGGVLHSARGMLRAMAGDRSGAEADIADAIRVGKSFLHFHHTAYAIGAIYTRLGNMDRAQEWIENAANDGFPNFTYFETDPHLERLRAVPRFRTFLAKLRQEWEHLPRESD